LSAATVFSRVIVAWDCAAISVSGTVGGALGDGLAEADAGVAAAFCALAAGWHKQSKPAHKTQIAAMRSAFVLGPAARGARPPDDKLRKRTILVDFMLIDANLTRRHC
jgi:hypothetical protein